MYCNHYKFSEKPFDVTPDPRFLYLTSDHRETLASIVYGICERRGFITVIGEVGTGKTTLLNAAIDRLDDKTRVAFIFNTDITFEEMLNTALYEWGLLKPQERLSKVDAIQKLNHFAIRQLDRGGNVVLIVDEAQNLDNRTMENLRLLSNLETRRHKLVQIVLSGQPELDTKLGQHELRQLAQRISLRRHVAPLDEKDTYAYLKHRLQIANHSGSSPFTPKAQQLIWEYTGGVPRKINILCDNAFLIGYGLKKNKINSAIVQEAAQDLKWHRFSDTQASLDVPLAETTSFTWVETKPFRRYLKLTAAMIIAGLIIFAGSLFLGRAVFPFTGLNDFFDNINGAALNVIQPDHQKQPAQLTFTPTPAQAVAAGQVIPPNSTGENAGIKAIADSEVNGPSLNSVQPEPENQPQPLLFKGLPAQPVRVTRIFVKDLVVQRAKRKTPLMDAKQSDLFILFKEDEIIRQIKVKKGDTLNHIIVQTYGAYDHDILKKVLLQNLDIIDPDKILTGQVIELPVDKD